jgi:lipid II:glycine glycyltransferase (peptidoglycan interpeptide bridge formation enzyme)
MGGSISSKPLRPGDLNAVLVDLQRQPEISFSIRPNPLKGEAWSTDLTNRINKIARVAHVLDLQGGFSAIWEKAFKSTARTAIRKAEKSGLTVEKDTTGRLVPVFYELFIQSLARWGTKQHEPLALARLRGRWRDPLKKFEILAQNLGPAFQIWVAWLNGEPAATILVLQGKNASYTRGAMNKELAGPTRANDLLHRMAIEDACLAGCRYYHMGETGESISLAAFKSNFGAQSVPYPEIFFEKLPISRLEKGIKTAVKKAIGFKDT